MSSLCHIGISIVIASTLVACGDSRNESPSLLESSGGSTECPNIPYAGPPTNPSNRAVITMAASGRLFGDQVGDGECASYVDKVLRDTGHKTFHQLGPTGPNANYVWGRHVATLTTGNRNASGLQRGDILQYRSFRQVVQKPNGGWWSSSAEHHTAIVARVSQDGKHICVYEQNVGGRRTVGTGYVNLNGMQQGTIWAYRPVLR